MHFNKMSVWKENLDDVSSAVRKVVGEKLSSLKSEKIAGWFAFIKTKGSGSDCGHMEDADGYVPPGCDVHVYCMYRSTSDEKKEETYLCEHYAVNECGTSSCDRISPLMSSSKIIAEGKWLLEQEFVKRRFKISLPDWPTWPPLVIEDIYDAINKEVYAEVNLQHLVAEHKSLALKSMMDEKENVLDTNRRNLLQKQILSLRKELKDAKLKVERIKANS